MRRAQINEHLCLSPRYPLLLRLPPPLPRTAQAGKPTPPTLQPSPRPRGVARPLPMLGLGAPRGGAALPVAAGHRTPIPRIRPPVAPPLCRPVGRDPWGGTRCRHPVPAELPSQDVEPLESRGGSDSVRAVVAYARPLYAGSVRAAPRPARSSAYSSRAIGRHSLGEKHQ